MEPEEQQRQLSKSEVERVIGEPIIDFSTSSGTKKGDNVAGNLLAIKVTTESNPSKPLHVLYKSFPVVMNPQQKQYLVQFGIFRIETCVYEKVIPRLLELLGKRAKVENKSLPVVKYISGFNNDESDYLCLEDMRHQDFIMQDKWNSLSVAEVSLVMKEIGRFHALTHFMIRYDGERIFEDESFQRIKNDAMKSDNPFITEMFSRMIYGNFECCVELLEGKDKGLSEHLKKFLQQYDRHRLFAASTLTAERTDVKSFPCLLHGDLWINNILFKYKEKGNRDNPTELKFIDFQRTRRGNIFEDLGYFFWTSTTPEFRKKHLTTMLGVYYDSFEKTMKELDFPKPEGFTKGSLIDGFNEGILPIFLFMPFAISLQMGDLTYMDKEKVDLETGKLIEEDKQKVQAPPEETPPGPPDFDKMAKDDKMMMRLRMIHSPRAIDRLVDITREIVDLGLLK